MRSEPGLPEGWISTRIDEISEVNPGKPPKDLLPADAPVSFVPMPAVDAEKGAITEPEVRQYHRVRNGYTAFRNEDLIVAKITPCMENGKAAVVRDLVNGWGFGSSEFHVLRSCGAILPEYLYHFVRQQSFRDDAAKQMTGSVGQKRVPADYIKCSVIPLPPLAEQRRIVAQLDALIADVERVRGRLEGVTATMQRFRQAVLESVFNGKITIGRGETSEPWTLVSIADVCEAIVDCPHSTPKWVTSGEICIRTSNFKPGRIDLSDTRYVSIETYLDRISRLEPKSGDILLSREGGILGVACMVPQGLKLCLGQRMMLLRVNESRYSSELLMHLLNAPPIQAVIKNMTGGTSSPHLNVGDVKRFQIPLPPLLEQHEIVRRVEALFALADRIEGEVATARKRIEALTQAVLAKAFRGELVPTEAELARREGREYEPAGVLLERVQSERQDCRPKSPARARRAAGQTALPGE